MARITSSVGFVDPLVDLDPKKLDKRITEELHTIKTQQEVNNKKALELRATRIALDELQRQLDASWEILRDNQKSYQQNLSEFEDKKKAFKKEFNSFDQIRKDFEGYKTQTMEELAVERMKAQKIREDIIDRAKKAEARMAENEKVSLALDEREKTLLSREEKAKELIEDYTRILAQLESITRKK